MKKAEKQREKTNKTVYFDNGATSFPKPDVMYRAMLDSMTYRGGNPGRAGHRLSVGASRDIFRLRERAASFFGCSLPENVIVTFNTTHALNIAIKSVLDSGDTVLYSDMEHNAVRRPVNSMIAERKVRGVCFKSYSDPKETFSSFKQLADLSKPKAVVCLHSSNICQRKLPIEQIGRYCRQKGIFFIVDGAQSGGHEKIEFDKFDIDALCLPGHKGLYGPMGTGLLIVSKNFADYIKNRPTLLDGGSGVDSNSLFMPTEFPERLEAGTIPAPLCSALAASIDFIDKIGLDSIAFHEHKLYRRLMDVLTSNSKVTVYLPEYKEGSVISFNVNGLEPWQTAELFDRMGFCMRAGIHCAPLAHQTLGTLSNGGTVRISLGIFNTEKEVALFQRALKSITN